MHLLDTNVLLDYPDMLFEFETIIFSSVVLSELDAHKNSPVLGYAAREALRNINRYILSGGKYTFESQIDARLTNDENIIKHALQYDAELITQDLAMHLTARSKKCKTSLMSEEFKEYHSENYAYIKNGFELTGEIVEGDDLETFKLYLKEQSLEVTPWMFYSTDNKNIYCYNPNMNYFENIQRWSPYQKDILVADGVKFKCKDQFQRMAVYAINRADGILINGKYGSGKSYIALATALSISQEGRKVYIMRPTVESGKYRIGFLPGSMNDKLEEYLSGFISSFYALWGNSKTVMSDKDGQFTTYDYVKEEIIPRYAEPMTINTLHGLSLQENDILILDEVQLLDRAYMSLLLSRVGKGAKVIMMGDLGQTISLIHKAESGLQALLSHLPHAGVACVDLKNCYRNKQLTDLADKILK